MAFDLGSPTDWGKVAGNIFNMGQNASPTNGEGPAASSQQSIIDQILGGLNRHPTRAEGMADLGSVLGGFSQGEKANRIDRGNFQQNYDQMMLTNQLGNNQLGLAAQTNRNQTEADALKKLQQTSYLMEGGSHFAPPTFQLGGMQRTAPSFAGIAPTAPSEGVMQGAASLNGQMLERLKDASFHPDQSFQPKSVDSYANPGMAEKLSSYGGAVSGGLGALDTILGGADKLGGISKMMQGAGHIPGLGSVGNIGSKLGSFLGGSGGAGAAGTAATGAATKILGKAVPIAGAVTGGLGLIHNQGIGKNLMNGVTAGASIGSMVPGLGTAVGAGIGAGVGALRSLGSIGKPNATELHGRDAHSSAISTLTQHATPEQIQAAHNAGWEKPQDALALISVRDQLIKNGMDPAQAVQRSNQLLDQLFKAEKMGPQAVQNVYNQISSQTGNA